MTLHFCLPYKARKAAKPPRFRRDRDRERPSQTKTHRCKSPRESGETMPRKSFYGGGPRTFPSCSFRTHNASRPLSRSFELVTKPNRTAGQQEPFCVRAREPMDMGEKWAKRFLNSCFCFCFVCCCLFLYFSLLFICSTSTSRIDNFYQRTTLASHFWTVRLTTVAPVATVGPVQDTTTTATAGFRLQIVCVPVVSINAATRWIRSLWEQMFNSFVVPSKSKFFRVTSKPPSEWKQSAWNDGRLAGCVCVCVHPCGHGPLMTGCCSYQEGVYCVQISGHPPEPGQSIHLYQVIRIAGFDLASLPCALIISRLWVARQRVVEVESGEFLFFVCVAFTS